MMLSKIRMVAVLVLTLGLLGAGTGALAYRLGTGTPPVKPQGRQGAEHRQADREPAKPAPVKAPRADNKAEQEARKVLARNRLRQEEGGYHQLEDEFSDALLKVRLEIVRQEERLRGLEGPRAGAFTRQRKGIEDTREELALAKKTIQRIAERTAQPEKEPAFVAAKSQVPHLEARLSNLENLARAMTRDQDDLIEARQQLVRLEEGLRRLERVQAMKRERALERVAAAAEQLRQAEGAATPPEAGSRGTADLGRRMDRLLQEMSELRRTVERLRAERGRSTEKE
jgi:hypothetical protein